jgi:hypothetical protein
MLRKRFLKGEKMTVEQIKSAIAYTARHLLILLVCVIVLVCLVVLVESPIAQKLIDIFVRFMKY